MECKAALCMVSIFLPQIPPSQTLSTGIFFNRAPSTFFNAIRLPTHLFPTYPRLFSPIFAFTRQRAHHKCKVFLRSSINNLLTISCRFENSTSLVI
jgi:hypothetical protein